MATERSLAFGYVARAHGLSGEVGIKTFDPKSEVLFELTRVVLRLKDGEEIELPIDSVRGSSNETLIAFEGIEDRSAAERLVGSQVLAVRDDLPPPEEGEYFQGDLVGLVAFDEQGNQLGTVEGILASGEVPNLIIRSVSGEELIVPFAEEFVPVVDLDARKMVVRPPQYLE